MILGKGMLARSFRDHDDITFFCSGVSNSGTDDGNEFLRERDLLSVCPSDRPLVYTSSLHAVTGGTAYQRHKLAMEDLVRAFPQHLILRVGNLVGTGQKPWQFFPSVVNQVKNGHVKVIHCRRDILAIKDYVVTVGRLLKEGVVGTFNLCAETSPLVMDVVDEIEESLGVRCTREVVGVEEFVFRPDLVTGRADYYVNVIKDFFHDKHTFLSCQQQDTFIRENRQVSPEGETL